MPVHWIVNVVSKLRRWGLVGAFHFICGAYSRYRRNRYFFRNAKLSVAGGCFQRGITVVGAFSSKGSLNKVLRDFVFSLQEAGIPVQTLDTGDGTLRGSVDLPSLTAEEDFRIKKYDHLVEMFSSPVPDGIVPHRARIAFWEFESGILEGFPELSGRHGDIIGMSDFNVAYFKRVFEPCRHVYKILYPFRFEHQILKSVVECRKRFGYGNSDFIVFYNFSFSSDWNRKNATGVMRAFAKALGGVRCAKLVFKGSFSKGFERRIAELRQLAQSLGIDNQFNLHTEYLTQAEIYEMTNMCDIYLSLHRGEGFGLGIAEAMALGKCVVATNFSATTEFCREGNSIPVSYGKCGVVPGDLELEWYRWVKLWVDPDVDDAAGKLKILFDDEVLRNRLGSAAQEFMEKYFSIENFKRSVNAYLDSEA